MPRRELKHPHQVENWLIELSGQITAPAGMILIGSGALLWHALLISKRKRNEPRDRAHEEWAKRVGLIE